MRPELKEMLLQDWSELSKKMEKPYGYMPHVEAILALEPSPEERVEIASMLVECDRGEPISTITGMMYVQPDPAYREALIKALDSSSSHKRFHAMRALLRGRYEGAWEILFNRPDVQVAMGDEFPWEICGSAGDLPEEWQRQYLDLFNERFKDDPPLHMLTRQWLRTLANVTVTDQRTVETLLRIWNRLEKGDHQDRYLLMQAMAAAPVPQYESILKKGAKSSLPDVKQFATKGLAKLKANQQTP